MNSMPASSAVRARARQSGQLPDQRSGTIVTARPDEQLAPNRPSFSRFALPIAARSRCLIVRSIGRSHRCPDSAASLAEPARIASPAGTPWIVGAPLSTVSQLQCGTVHRLLYLATRLLRAFPKPQAAAAAQIAPPTNGWQANRGAAVVA